MQGQNVSCISYGRIDNKSGSCKIYLASKRKDDSCKIYLARVHTVLYVRKIYLARDMCEISLARVIMQEYILQDI